MNLTLHIVRKDLVRMRGWIACWVALLLVPIVMGAMLIANNPFTDQDWNLPDKTAILTGVEVFVGYLLTILVIQEDSVVGTQQFWLTRPISRGRLLLAKAIGAFVIVGLVPVAVSVPWWLWCGFTVGQMAGVAAETLLVLGIAMLLAAVVAVLTESFARALLWSLALVAVVLFAGFLFTMAITGPTSSNHASSLALTRSILAIVAVAAEMGVIVIAQFHLRRRGWWLAAAGGVVAITMVASTQWPSPWASGEPREHHPERASGVTVQFHRAGAGPRPNGMELQRVGAQLIIGGVPRELELLSALAKQRWTWPNGMSMDRLEFFHADAGTGRRWGLETGVTDEETKRAMAENLNRRTKRDFAPDEHLGEAMAWLPPSIVERMRTEPPKFEARLWWQVVRPELRLEVPLAPGRWTARNGHGVGIERVQSDADTMTITLVATRPVLITRLLRAMDEWYRRYEEDNEQWWALLDRERGRMTYVFGEHSADKPRWIIVNGVKIEWRTHIAARRGVIRNGKGVRDPDWRIGTSLAIVTMRDEAVISREVRVDRFLPTN